jgi:hypothetical protein
MSGATSRPIRCGFPRPENRGKATYRAREGGAGSRALPVLRKVVGPTQGWRRARKKGRSRGGGSDFEVARVILEERRDAMRETHQVTSKFIDMYDQAIRIYGTSRI